MDDDKMTVSSKEHRHIQGENDPVIRAMMAEYMVSASEYLIPSLGLPLLSGYETLAYYYVVIKKTRPKFLSAPDLCYDNVYALPSACTSQKNNLVS